MSAQDVLDRVQSLAAVEALEPAQYARQLAAELAPAASLAELEVRDAAFAGALRRIDDMIARVMRLRLEHVLAADASIGAPTRRVFASTIVNYAQDLSLLAGRARDLAARGGAADPAAIGDAIVEAARATLELREALRGPVLELVRALATAAIPAANRRARDRDLGDAERKRWSAARRDFEMIADDPSRVLAAAMAARLAAWPEQLDDPEPAPEVPLAELIELD